MPRTNKLQEILLSSTLRRRALQGAGLALLLLVAFLLVAGVLNDGIWVTLPLLTVSVGGAFGGAFFYLMDQLVEEGGWKRLLTHIACALIYFAGLWMSLIAALSVVGLWD